MLCKLQAKRKKCHQTSSVPWQSPVIKKNAECKKSPMEFWRSNFFRWHRENTPCRPYSLQTSRFILLVTAVNLCEPLDMPSHFLSHGVWSSLPSHFMIAINPMVHVDHVVHLLSCSLFEFSEFTTTTLFGGQQTQTKNLLHSVAGAFASSGNM